MNKKIRWQDVCPNCVKYHDVDHQSACDCCQQEGLSEDVLCKLNRMDQQNDDADFQCDAYEPKQGAQ
ncbi:MAG: hypothetical protein KAV87_58035 [Desulfobacteraceae bacterium]|nr:hypothetical protein [Desulfobacteraceae bacterium]